MKKVIDIVLMGIVFFAPIIFPIFMAILYWGYGIR